MTTEQRTELKAMLDEVVSDMRLLQSERPLSIFDPTSETYRFAETASKFRQMLRC